MDAKTKNAISYNLYKILTGGDSYDEFKIALEYALVKGFPIDYIYPERPFGQPFISILLQHSGWLDEHLTKGLYDTVRFLLNKGADVNITDNVGCNVLMYATYYSIKHIPQDIFARIVRDTKDLELPAPAYPDTNMVRIPPQTTALVLAAKGYLWKSYREKYKTNCWNCIETLLEAGADIDKLNSENVASFTLDREEKRYYKDFVDKMIRYKEQMVQLNNNNPAQADWDYEL